MLLGIVLYGSIKAFYRKDCSTGSLTFCHYTDEYLNSHTIFEILEGTERVVGTVDHTVNVLTYRALEWVLRHTIFHKWTAATLSAIGLGFLYSAQAGDVAMDVFNFARGLVGFAPGNGYATY